MNRKMETDEIKKVVVDEIGKIYGLDKMLQSIIDDEVSEAEVVEKVSSWWER